MEVCVSEGIEDARETERQSWLRFLQRNRGLWLLGWYLLVYLLVDVLA